MYILDEPTTGLHFYDIQMLSMFYRLRDQGNTLVVIEHNLDVIKTADWLIDLGPEGGTMVKILICGTESPAAENSHTGRFLSHFFQHNGR